MTASTSEVVVAQVAEALLAFVDGWPEGIGLPSEQGNLVTWVRRRIAATSERGVGELTFDAFGVTPEA